MSVIWTDPATEQLEAIQGHIATTNPASAQALAVRIVTRTEALDGQPLFGAEVPEYADTAIREVFESPYRIIYRVRGPDVEVLAVIHAARRLPRTPPG